MAGLFLSLATLNLVCRRVHVQISLTLQLNLFGGTLTMWLSERPRIFFKDMWLRWPALQTLRLKQVKNVSFENLRLVLCVATNHRQKKKLCSKNRTSPSGRIVGRLSFFLAGGNAIRLKVSIYDKIRRASEERSLSEEKSKTLIVLFVTNACLQFAS